MCVKLSELYRPPRLAALILKYSRTPELVTPSRASETESVLRIGQMETSGLKLELSTPWGLLAARMASERMVS